MQNNIVKISMIVIFQIFIGGAYALASDVQNQIEMNQVAAQQLSATNRELNEIYDKLYSNISKSGQIALRKAQDTWEEYREQECDFATLGSKGGSLHSLAVSRCREDMARQRIIEIQHQLSCEEGDYSCGNQ